MPNAPAVSEIDRPAKKWRRPSHRPPAADERSAVAAATDAAHLIGAAEAVCDAIADAFAMLRATPGAA